MLGALDESLRAQRQLVADASHELRTPLTSLRTNVELVARGGLPAAERRRALDDAQAQIAELSALVADVVELAREGEPEPVLEDVRLDLLVAAEVRRAERRGVPVTFASRLGEVVVRGDADRLQRAVANILDNAVEVEPAGRDRRGRRRAPGRDRPRPRAGNRAGRSSVRVRSLLPRSGGPRDARVRAGARDRAPRGGAARRHGHRRGGRGRRDARAPAAGPGCLS